VGGVGNSVIVQIIDSCPSVSAYNYCKTNVPKEERCGAGNSLDIDYNAYQALTGGTPWNNVRFASLFSVKSEFMLTLLSERTQPQHRHRAKRLLSNRIERRMIVLSG